MTEQSQTSSIEPPDAPVTLQLSLSRWHNIAKRLSKLATEASEKAEAGLAGARVDGYAGNAQIDALKAGKHEARDALSLALGLQSDIGEVREAIGQANARTGVAALLARQESINRSSKLLRDIISAQKPGMVPVDGLASYKPIVHGETRHFYRNDDNGAIAVGLLDPDELNAFKRQLGDLQARGFRLADDINDLNRELITATVSRQAALLAGLIVA